MNQEMSQFFGSRNLLFSSPNIKNRMKSHSSCSINFTKYFLVTVNIFIWFYGVAFLSFGIWLQVAFWNRNVSNFINVPINVPLITEQQQTSSSQQPSYYWSRESWTQSSLSISVGQATATSFNRLSSVKIQGISSSKPNMNPYNFMRVSIIMVMTVACFLLLIAALGIVFACREISKGLIFYAILLLLMFLLQSAFIVLCFLLIYTQLFNSEQVESSVGKLINGEYINLEFILDAIALTQIEFKCCGFNNNTDWLNAEWYSGSSDYFKMSCCKLIDGNNNLQPNPINRGACLNSSLSQFNTQGCRPILERMIDKYSTIILTVSIIISAFEICAVITSMILASYTRNRGIIY